MTTVDLLTPPPLLTARQQDVVTLLAFGLDNAELARELHLSEDTVKSHVSAVMRRLGARNRAHAVAIWVGGEEWRRESDALEAA